MFNNGKVKNSTFYDCQHFTNTVLPRTKIGDQRHLACTKKLVLDQFCKK